MKINGLEPQDVYKSYINSAARNDGENSEAETEAAADVSADRVEISPSSSRLSEARELTRRAGVGTGDDAAARSGKVASIKSAVDSGSYSVPAEDVAQSILEGRSFGGES